MSLFDQSRLADIKHLTEFERVALACRFRERLPAILRYVDNPLDDVSDEDIDAIKEISNDIYLAGKLASLRGRCEGLSRKLIQGGAGEETDD